MTLDLLFDASIKKQPWINKIQKQKILAKEPLPAKQAVEELSIRVASGTLISLFWYQNQVFCHIHVLKN